ncbi:response regulator transcription factor [Acetobacter oeni]|uniref:DNA-binding response regulator n=1 Tax=Acetobacter oeni TaxID=304077 RepID=A0A511XQV2_9PROT|nr:response regulator transcription factor [Acetobacter oeni]MBB3884963.1 two-component system OmpR family response regulator [Acetobacter oeni]NHO20835.1 response regulator [Acetobacter oeni]GBR06783.1 two component response regulator [Acetobacter oeni LMG 21952]GEN65340.1 DNA-binding response regulator [Acetobacter oeni]
MTDNSHKATPRVLLVEDDLDTATYIERSPVLAHVAITVVADGTQGQSLAFNESWDCIILDRRLPGLDGLSILQAMRAADIQTPVLFLTTMDGVSDRVTGLRRGADDYLVKPFSVIELSARLDALLRRTGSHPQETRLIFADVELDLLQREVYRAGQKLYIQSQELNLLEYFMRRPFVVVTREMLLQAVWDIDFPIRTNLVETHISRLRERLGRDAPPLIHTVRGQGYVLRRS